MTRGPRLPNPAKARSVKARAHTFCVALNDAERDAAHRLARERGLTVADLFRSLLEQAVRKTHGGGGQSTRESPPCGPPWVELRQPSDAERAAYPGIWWFAKLDGQWIPYGPATMSDLVDGLNECGPG